MRCYSAELVFNVLLITVSFTDIPARIAVKNGTIPLRTNTISLSSNSLLTLSWDPGFLENVTSVQISMFWYNRTTVDGITYRNLQHLLIITPETQNNGTYQFLPSALTAPRISNPGSVVIGLFQATHGVGIPLPFIMLPGYMDSCL